MGWSVLVECDQEEWLVRVVDDFDSADFDITMVQVIEKSLLAKYDGFLDLVLHAWSQLSEVDLGLGILIYNHQ